ncbi:MAG TPA: GNAT family N-acetyltransferase [Ktedonobacteraceae bacterium]|nr:GNAT family N-acetyltransferase [Ktedonobacteraceae bacterium]
MNKRLLTSSPDFVIRSPRTADEIETYFRLNAETFRPDEDLVLVASRRRRLIIRDPDYHLIHLRSAFYGKAYVGSCRIQERWLCLESTRLHVGCIGGVVTHPDYRHQGVATALMQDAFAYARRQQYDLLLLHGIPDYYKQHGYIDVCEDMPQHAISRALIPGLFSDMRIVRLADLHDAPILLALYQEHYGASMYTFAPTRTLERQAHYLENWFQENIPLLALNAEGKAEGYLLLSRRRGRLYAYEAAANTWPAMLALLQHQNHLLEAEAEAPPEMCWPLPPSDATYYLLADHLPVRSEMNSYPDGGWMARIVSLSTLIQSLLPLWQYRWQKQYYEWAGIITLAVDEQTCSLELSPRSIRLVSHLSIEGQQVRLSQQIFTQLVFGFRPVAWAATQNEQYIPAELIPVLDILLPLKQSWIAGSDYF